MLPTPMPVVTRDGIRGAIAPEAWLQGSDQSEIAVTFEDGTQLRVPTSALEARMSGGYWLMLSRDELQSLGLNFDSATRRDAVTVSDELVIPIIEETAEVRVERTAVGKVRIHKTVETREEQIQEPLFNERVQVERRAVNREVDNPPATRREGDSLIIPVVEEILVVQKRYVLKEEIIVTRERIANDHPQSYTLRREDVTVERVSADSESAENNTP